MALRVAQSNASEIERSHMASLDRFSVPGIASIVAVMAALLADIPRDTPLGSDATSLLCLALLVFGLPHGSLDIALVQRSARLGGWQVVGTVALYLGCAAAMYAVWQFAPVLALASFLLVASVHFAEDWVGRLPPFFAMGTGVALLTAPALLHHRVLADILVSLTGRASATVIADLALLVAPVALVVTGIGLWLMVRNRQSEKALETGTAIVGLVFLSPILGFAIFFCLLHSPRHFAAARAEVRGRDGEALLITLAALGIATLIYALRGDVMEDNAVFAAFVTLSVLTVPHMIVPRCFNSISHQIGSPR